MAQGRLEFEYEPDEKADSVTAWGGLPLVAEVLTALGVDASVRQHIPLSRGRREFDAAALVKAFVLMMAAGGDCFDDIEILREDTALCRLLGARLPSAETLRQFLYDFHEDRLIERAQERAIDEGQKSYVPEETERLKGLARVQADFVKEISRRWPQTTATVDIDATLQESHKREAKQHYQGGRGYQPVIAHWAEAELVVADEFRDGNVPAHKDVLGVLQRAFAALPATVTKRRLRGDSAMCTTPVLEFACAQQIEFAIGGDASKALEAAYEALPESAWSKLEDRADSEVHVSEVPPVTAMLQRFPVRIIVVRVRPRQRELLGTSRMLHLSIVTNLTTPPAEVATWYWQKAGTIEHVHAVAKNELGAGVLPCGRFGANAAWLRLALLTYNVLRVVRHTGPDDLKDARPKRLRLNLLALPTVVVRHARQLVGRVANRLQRAVTLCAARTSLWAPGIA